MAQKRPEEHLPEETLAQYVRRKLDPKPQGLDVEEVVHPEKSKRERTPGELKQTIKDLRKRIQENLRVIELQQTRIWELEYRLRGPADRD